MGRRALRKIDSSLDLSRHLRTLEELPCPLQPAALFGRSAPLQIEIGSGKGLFLAAASERCPHDDFLGIELARRYARFTAARLARLERPNALIIHGDARRLFTECLEDRCAAAVHIYFPDPWWKKKHHKRRLMQRGFLEHVARVLQPQGRLHFWTDVADYFEESCREISLVPALAGPLPSAAGEPAHDLDYRTHFERRMRLHNQEVYRAEFEKVP